MNYVRVDPRGHSLAGIAGSNPAGGMDVCLLQVLCVVRLEVSLVGWSLVQRCPTLCVCVFVSLRVIRRNI